MAVHARQTKVGINIATSGSWGTGSAVATAVGAGDGVYVRDDMGIQLRQMYSLDDSAGQSFIGSVQVGRTEAVAVAIPAYLHYNDAFQNVLWALTLGTGGTSPTQVGTTTAYTNTFEPATNKTGRYATIVRDKSQYVSEVPGAKFTGFELTFGADGRAEITWNALGDTEKTDSSINTATQISALTFPTLGLRAFMDQAVFRINAIGGSALAASDALPCSSIRVSFAQSMDARHVAGQRSIIEPEEDGFPEILIELVMDRFQSNTDDYFAGHQNVTAYKADLILTGATIATTNYGIAFKFPHVVAEQYAAPVPGGADQVRPTTRLRALSTTSAPTGFTGITAPMRIITTGSATTNPFT